MESTLQVIMNVCKKSASTSEAYGKLMDILGRDSDVRDYAQVKHQRRKLIKAGLVTPAQRHQAVNIATQFAEVILGVLLVAQH